MFDGAGAHVKLLQALEACISDNTRGVSTVEVAILCSLPAKLERVKTFSDLHEQIH